jgi:hypothetical protein
VGVSVSVSVSVYVYVYVYVCVGVGVGVGVCVSVSVYVYVCVCVYIYIFYYSAQSKRVFVWGGQTGPGIQSEHVTASCDEGSGMRVGETHPPLRHACGGSCSPTSRAGGGGGAGVGAGLGGSWGGRVSGGGGGEGRGGGGVIDLGTEFPSGESGAPAGDKLRVTIRGAW